MFDDEIRGKKESLLWICCGLAMPVNTDSKIKTSDAHKKKGRHFV